MSVWSEAGAVRLLPVLLLPRLHPRQPPPEVLQEEVRLQAAECKGGWRWVRRRLLPAPRPEAGQQGDLRPVQVRLLHYYGLCFCDSVLWLFSCTLSQEKGNGYLLELQHQEKRIFLFAKSFKLNLNSITQHRSTFLFQVTMWPNITEENWGSQKRQMMMLSCYQLLWGGP